MLLQSRLPLIWISTTILTVITLCGCDDNRPQNVPNKTSEIMTKVTDFKFKDHYLHDYSGNANITLIENNNEYLLAMHKDIDLYEDKKYHTELEFISFDNKWQVVNQQTLNISEYYQPQEKASAPQDPRLFRVNDNLYMIYNEKTQGDKNRRMFLAKLTQNKNQLVVDKAAPLNYQQQLTQKNWTPFVYDNEIYFIYSVQPYIVLKLDQKTSQLSEVTNQNTDKIKWPYGLIRGGTPAIYVKELDAYLTFFHSSLPYKKNEPKWPERRSAPWRIYYVGVLVFDSKPPFAIRAYTEVPITYKDAYADSTPKHQIIFPMGLIERDKDYLISAGIQNGSADLFTIDKVVLKNALHYF